MTDKRRDPWGLAARLLVGGVLVYAGAGKAATPPEEFALVISYYRILPRDMVLTSAALLPWAELLIGWSLAAGFYARAAAAAAAALFALFLAALVSTLVRGLELPNCGCFGDALHFTIPQALLFDGMMLALCWLALRRAPGAWSLDTWAQGGYTSRR